MGSPVGAVCMISRTASIVSRRCGAGLPYSTACHVSLSRLTPAPRPRRNRPPDISSMSSAETARMKALRVKAQAIPVPTPTASVLAASQAACVTELRKSSGVQMQSMPATSAMLACSARSSTVSPIAAIEMWSRAPTARTLVPGFLDGGVVERAPQIETGERPVRTPRLGDPLDLGDAGQLLEAVGDLDRATDPEISGRDDVRPPQVEDQEHLGRPQPDALHRDQLRAD